jgi:excinuclease ABC subunit C
MTQSDIHLNINLLPDKPGVYQFFDADGIILYIGKAKNLKKRVQSYFVSGSANGGKIAVLVKRIKDIKYTVVETESDALLLENNLIKQYKPKYNILLKDDKTYPWICIRNEPFPRVLTTRRYIPDGSLYFGPYTSGILVKTLINLIKSLYPLRTCNLNLSPKNIQMGKFKACLEYQMGNCMAPCIGNQTIDQYNTGIEAIKSILKGNLSEVIKWIKEGMAQAVATYNFELAHQLKCKLDILERYQSKSTIVNPSNSDLDVFAIMQKDGITVTNYFNVVKGAIVQTYSLELKPNLDEGIEELLTVAISEIRDRVRSQSKTILASAMPDFQLDGIKYLVPARGDKKKLIELGLRNCASQILEIERRNEIQKPHDRTQRILLAIQKDLQIDELPTHIECFDNSNLQGTNPVSSCVVFRNAKPTKRDYRHYIVKTVNGPDDFSTMKEVVYRRYHRLLSEETPLPQLVVIDGGKGQVNAAFKSLASLGIENRVRLIGIAKKLEEIYFPGDPIPLYLDKKSETLKVIQHLRNEAHRFGVKLHTARRSRKSIQSELRSIPGVGDKTVDLLFKEYKTIQAIIDSDEKILAGLVGASKASKIVNYFKNNR